MKKLKWLVSFVLVLLLVSNIKAGNCAAMQNGKMTIAAKAQQIGAPATLIEQILFPHGM